MATKDSSTKYSVEDVTLKLNTLMNESAAWEAEEFARSNQRLYQILSNCYDLYLRTKGHSKLIARFDIVLANRNVVVRRDTDLALKVIKCVFGADDRRRTYAYAVVLRRAHKDNVKPSKLADWINKWGGVEEVRLNDAPTADPKVVRAKRRDLAITELTTSAPVATLPKQPDAPASDSGLVMCLGVVQADGSVNIVKFVDESLIPPVLEKLGKSIQAANRQAAIEAADAEADSKTNAAIEQAAMPSVEQAAA